MYTQAHYDPSHDTVARRVPFRYRWKSDLLNALLTACEVVSQLLIWALCIFGICSVLYVLTLHQVKASEPAQGFRAASGRPAPCAPEEVLGCHQRLCQTPVPVYALGLTAEARLMLHNAVDFWNMKFRAGPVFEWRVPPAKGLIPPGGVVVFVGEYNEKTLMVTAMQPNMVNMCATNSIIAITQPLNHFSLLGLYHGFRHELGHVIGLPDTYVEGCVMTGHGDPLVDHLSPYLCEPEARLLRAIYPAEGF